MSAFFALLALAISLRFTSTLGWQHHLEYAADRYDVIARNLVERGLYLDRDGSRAYRLPGYSLFLAALFAAFDDSEAAVRIFQSVLAALIVYLATAFTWRLTRHRWAVIATGVICCSSYMLYWSAALLATEILFALLLMLLVIALHRRMYLLAGALCGIALLTRGNLLPAVPLLVLVVLCDRR